MTRRRRLLLPLLAWLAWLLLWCLHRTYRVTLHGTLPEQRPLLFAFWHGEQQLILPHRPTKALCTLSSLSDDGRLQAKILSHFKIQTIAGSSSRGAISALRALTRQLQQGTSIALAVDGPRGPLHEVKPGIIHLAKATSTTPTTPIIPIRAYTNRAWTFPRSWDQFMIPKPFAHLDIFFLPPIQIPSPLPRAERLPFAQKIRAELLNHQPPT